MKAVTVDDGGLTVTEVPIPRPGPREALVQVRASAINGADHYLRVGRYPDTSSGGGPLIPGLEVAGVVAEVGPGTELEPGTRVMGLTPWGGHAEYVAVDERLLLPVPEQWRWTEAGAFCEAFTAAHDALVTQGGAREGSRVLITGANGGVGTAALQIARTTGCAVSALVRDPAVAEHVRRLGADEVHLHPDDLSPDRFDVVLELVTGANITKQIAALRTGGRIVVLGCAAHPRADFNLLKLMAKRASIGGSTLRSRPVEEKAQALALAYRAVEHAARDGSVTIPVDAIFELADAPQAYERFEMKGKTGRVVLVTSSA
ncbi:NADPH:quinone reductase [Pseudonocardia thermophila]|mgnify:CR=1 FL=1|uniref:NADPH:quinone reductase n=1 Tax=Pseudonocardia thermophila TaxID=1848 RepID=A0A1M6N3N1_PSETH|nr:zinc-binding dehydrogenase [Pseudonocardia thermophila]SHJ90300.1 NADPH:quinone reductase [Pseudonocardia thermophila]